MPGLLPIDLLAAIILGAATVRGLFNGLIREVFSLIALAAAVMAVRVWNEPLSEWLSGLLGGRVSPGVLPWVSGAVLGVAVVIAVGMFGAVMGRGARAVGLGWADRTAGAALGIAEGAIVVSVVLLMVGSVVGRNHPSLATSRSLALFEQVERAAADAARAPADVAAPPPKGS